MAHTSTPRTHLPVTLPQNFRPLCKDSAGRLALFSVHRLPPTMKPLAWAAAGAPDGSLVFADAQTRGRGRMGASWFTPPGAALAFSLVLRPCPAERQHTALFSGLGALALGGCASDLWFAGAHQMAERRLVERQENRRHSGRNGLDGDGRGKRDPGDRRQRPPEAVPPPEGLTYPATCIHAARPNPILPRLTLLQTLLESALAATGNPAGSQSFRRDWEAAPPFAAKLSACGSHPPRPSRGAFSAWRPMAVCAWAWPMAGNRSSASAKCICAWPCDILPAPR